MSSFISYTQSKGIEDRYRENYEKTKDPKDLKKLELQIRANEAMLNSGITETPKADTNASSISSKK
ncbi:MAG: hypothetical protein KR126chlam5_01349 [Candidatus Anoxychlamydiales bacterium]|nr:hypothetical protein [Candidatus Anoxychlamydiales bacterium]